MNHLLVQLLWNLRFRGKVRLLSPLVPKSGHRFATVFGSRVRLDLFEFNQRMVYLGAFEREETNLLLRELRPGMTVVDIGANCGYYTYLASQRVGPSGRVLAVEPSEVADVLDTAICSNGLSNVTLIRTALGPQAGELTLHVPPASIGNHAPTVIVQAGWTPLTVPVQRLDDLLDEHKIDRVDVLKIDVEGFEGEVFAGASESLASGRIRALLVEFNEWCLTHAGWSADKLWDRLVAAGYEPAVTKPSAFDPKTPINCFFRKS